MNNNFFHRILFLFLLLALVGCGKSSSSLSKQHLRINIASDPQHLDPRKARDLNAVTLMHMLFEGLTRIGKNGALELALAKSYEVSPDGLRYEFHLRKALWSNGSAVTSFDFAHSWRKTLSPSFPSDIAYQLYPIKGAKATKLGENVKLGIETPNPFTLIVELEEPIPYFLELLSTPGFFPVSVQAEEKNPKWFDQASSYVCNGPFLLHSWSHSDRIELHRNPSYWDSKDVRLERIDLLMVTNETELRLFEQGDLDWAGSPLSSLPADAISHLKTNGMFQTSPLLGTYFLRVNTQDPELSDPLFRRALAASINRQEIVEHILQGGQMIATALVPPCLGVSSNGFFKNAALKEIKQSTLTLLYQQTDRNHLIAQTLQQQFKSQGVELRLEAVERNTFFERVSKKNYQLAVGSWIADYNDPINFLEVFKFNTSSTNNTGWEDPQYTNYLSLSSVCTNPEERLSLLRKAEEILMEQMPIIPIFHYSMNYLQQKELKDVVLSPIGQIDFRWAHKEGDEIALSTAGTLMLWNDSIYILTAHVYTQYGEPLGQVTIQPGQQSSYTTSLYNTQINRPGAPQYAITPYRVLWTCPNGATFSMCSDVASSALVRASQCPGQQLCKEKQLPPEKQPKK